MLEYFNEDQIYKYFEEEIKKESLKKIKKLHQEVEEIKSKELTKMENEIKAQANITYETKLRELKNHHRIEIRDITNQSYLHLKQKRDELLNYVFNNVKDRLNNFVNSNQYDEFIQTKLNKVNNVFQNDVVTFKVSKNDSRIKTIIQNNYHNKYQVEDSADIKIGGFQAYSYEKGLEIDETIDFKWNEKMQWFYENSKLFIHN